MNNKISFYFFKKQKEKKLSFFLLLISCSIFFYLILKNKAIILSSFNPQVFEKLYLESQWVNPLSAKPISDIELYAYAGYRYLKGENPILINPEVPPLGKYLIGLSILIFKNHRIINIIFCLIALILIFFISKLIFNSLFFASLSVFLTSINTLYQDQIINAGQLEIFQLVFILGFILFFYSYQTKKKFIYLFLAGILFGAFSSVKFFLYFFLLGNTSLITYFFIQQPKKPKDFFSFLALLLLINSLGLMVFISSYWRFFLDTKSLFEFLGVQKWIFLFYTQSSIDELKTIGSYLSLIFLNRWRYWSEGYPYIQASNWNLIWPLTFSLGIFGFLKIIQSKSLRKNYLLKIIYSFFLVNNIFLFFTPIYPRYLLILLIPLNIVIPVLFKR